MLGGMGMEASGKLYKIFDAKQITERFRKREFVVEMADNPTYPQYVLFQLTGDRCENIDALREGDEVRVEFRLSGREWTSPQGETKYFNSLDVWSVASVGAGAGAGHHGEESPPPGEPPPPSDSDDIPF